MKRYLILFATIFATDFGLTAGSTSKTVDSHMAKRSKNSIREEIGEDMKAALDDCIELSLRIADLQGKIATLEQRLLTKGEELLDGGSAFKKTHSELVRSLSIMEDSQKTIAHVVARIDADACLGGTGQG